MDQFAGKGAPYYAAHTKNHRQKHHPRLPGANHSLESCSVSIPAYPPAFWVVAVIAILLIGVSKAGFGGGIGALATPLIALTIPVADAAALLLPLLIIADIFSLRHYWNVYDRRSIALMVPGSVIGIALGGFLFGYFSGNETLLKQILGAFSLLFVLYQGTRTLILGALEKAKPNAVAGVALGAAAGFTSTLAHAGGPPAIMYLLPQKLPRQVYVGTTVILFALINLIKLVPYAYLGLLRIGNITTILLLAPLTYVGVALGIFLVRRFNDLWFNRVIYGLLAFTGLELLSGQSVIQWFF
jgi:uncharacterized membrane protein YfcA